MENRLLVVSSWGVEQWLLRSHRRNSEEGTVFYIMWGGVYMKLCIGQNSENYTSGRTFMYAVSQVRRGWGDMTTMWCLGLDLGIERED